MNNLNITLEWAIYTLIFTSALLTCTLYFVSMSERNEVYMEVAECMGSDRSHESYDACFIAVKNSRSIANTHVIQDR